MTCWAFSFSFQVFEVHCVFYPSAQVSLELTTFQTSHIRLVAAILDSGGINYSITSIECKSLRSSGLDCCLLPVQFTL